MGGFENRFHQGVRNHRGKGATADEYFFGVYSRPESEEGSEGGSAGESGGGGGVVCSWIERVEELDAGQGPVALDRARRDVEDAGNLLDRGAAKITKLNDAGLTRIVGGQAGQSFVESKNFVHPFGRNGKLIVHLNALRGPGTTLSTMGPGVVHQDLAHDPCSEPDEMRAAGPVNGISGEPQVSLVNEGGGLEGVVWALAAHVGTGKAMKLGVEQREEPIGCCRVT